MIASAFQIAEMPNIDAIAAIRSGIAPRAFTQVAALLGLSDEALAGKLGVSIRTVREQRTRTRRLSPAISEKLVRTARVQRLARTIFQTDDAVSQWLGSPAPALAGQAPIDLLDTETGAREVEGLINAIAYGHVI